MSKSLQKIQNKAAPLSVMAAQAEAILFLAADPVPESEIRETLGVSAHELSAALKELEEHLAAGHGLVLRSLGGGWLMETNPHFAEVLARFRDAVRRDRVRLSKAAVETLSIIAYNQPVTRGDVEDFRGVRSEGVIERLLDLKLIRISGRRKASGSPLLYRTTDRFLEIFGLEAIADLPTLEELQELGAAPEAAEPVSESVSQGEDCGDAT